MSKPRLLLLALAAGMAYLVFELMIAQADLTPDRLMEVAREAREGGKPDFRTALRRIDQGIALAQRSDDQDVVASFERERLRVLTERYSRSSAETPWVKDTTDLERIVSGCRAWLAVHDAKDPEVLEMGARAALSLDDPESATVFLEALRPVTTDTGVAAELSGEAWRALAAQRRFSLELEIEARLPAEDARALIAKIRRLGARPADDP